MKEIGSEFWTCNVENEKRSGDFFDLGCDSKLLMSGRTAIDFVLSDIEDDLKIVYMPDYCCASMVEPFLDNNYKIVYYSVDLINNNYIIDVNIKCSVFFAISYFGYQSKIVDKYISIFSKKNVTVIEDITHRLLCNNNYCNDSYYLICSLRKWFPVISGGLAVNVHSKFKSSVLEKKLTIDSRFVDLKKEAMDKKRDYMSGKTNKKEEYLELYNKSNNMVHDYKNKAIDELSIKILNGIDYKKIREKRISNSLKIEKKLKNSKKIRLIFKLEDGDCPLFVPVIIENRDEVRAKLIKNNIYLPVHWPNNNIYNKLHDIELSLVNDQRYSEKDIENYIDKLIEIVGE